ncbi:desulfoferrodoxin [Clostridium oryzae]|uniref:Desulfoferrodoxin n=1 Tax=Clostridium oryzae TaxID=1450648 RepID=A0A1V4IUV0_9CLOT|nr:desulfoferrodoxin [Clostridium oryzae]OPJ63565.1 desulfoferrodoxin [Clostridium oryzae]
MIEKHQIYKCDICGNIIEVLYAGGGSFVCCDKPMILLVENTTEAAVEKHIPVVENRDGKILVKVGSVEHPMEPEHYIMWIEVETSSKIYRKYLEPGQKPEALFEIDEEIVLVREYCNIHGLWKA